MTSAITPSLSAFDTSGYSLVVALAFLLLLIAADIVMGLPKETRDRCSRALNIAIIPLGMTFLVIAISHVIDVLR